MKSPFPLTMERVRPQNTDELLKISNDSGVLKSGEVETLLGEILNEFHQGKLPANHEVYAAFRNEIPLGWAYFAPSFKASDVWDLWWIGVAPGEQKAGIGNELLKFVERNIASRGGRILIVETSSTENLRAARDFYARRGYQNCGRIPDFYGEGDDKITFAKKVKSSSSAGELQ